MEKYIDSVVGLPCSVGIVWRNTYSVVSLPCSVGIVWRSTLIVWSVYPALQALCGEVH